MLRVVFLLPEEPLQKLLELTDLTLDTVEIPLGQDVDSGDMGICRGRDL